MKSGIVGAAAALLLLAGCSSWSSGGGGPAMSSEPTNHGNNTAGVNSAPTSQPQGGSGAVEGGAVGSNGTPPNASQQ